MNNLLKTFNNLCMNTECTEDMDDEMDDDEMDDETNDQNNELNITMYNYQNYESLIDFFNSEYYLRPFFDHYIKCSKQQQHWLESEFKKKNYSFDELILEYHELFEDNHFTILMYDTFYASEYLLNYPEFVSKKCNIILPVNLPPIEKRTRKDVIEWMKTLKPGIISYAGW